jgi:hypothetical protein
VKELYLDPRYYPLHFKLKMIAMVCNFNYFFVVLNIGNITGNIFRVGMSYGLSEMVGVYLSEPLIKRLPDVTAFTIAMSTVILINILIHTLPDLSEEVSIFLFSIQVFFVGMCWNLQFIIQEKRTRPEHLSVALELNMSCSTLFSGIVPILVGASNPVKAIVVTVVGLVSIICAILAG